MNKFIHWCFIIGVLSSCSAQKNEPWWEKPSEEWPQFLLTNSISFQGRTPVSGASSFILSTSSDTVICTARHLIEEPMGVVPPVGQDSLNSLLTYWYAYPRSSANCDSVRISHLRNTSPSVKDFLVLEGEYQSACISALPPAKDSAIVSDTIYILGCVRSDNSCTQNVYHSTVKWVVDSQIIVEPSEQFNASGFSGAPALNTRGEVVGIVTSVYNQNNEFYIYLESISEVLPYLR